LFASTPTKTCKTATHPTKEKLTNQQDHKLNSAWKTTHYQHKNSPKQLNRKTEQQIPSAQQLL
jgi:uncharacterized protein YecT (DUF1311 family)